MTKKIAIATFTFIPETNGISLSTYNLLTCLNSESHELTIITNRHIAIQNSDTYNIVEFAIEGSGVFRNRFSGEIQEYVNYLKGSKFDIIYFICWHSWPLDLALPIFPELKCKKVLISHGVSNHKFNILSPRSILNRLKWASYFRQMPAALNQFDWIVFLSNKMDDDRMFDRKLALAEEIKTSSVIPNVPSFLTLINTGLVKQHYSKLKANPAIVGKFVVLTVSNYEPIKNQMLTLECFLKARLPNSILIFIGSTFNKLSERLYNHYLKMKSRHCYPGEVIFLAGVSREYIFANYLLANLFLLTSKSEVQPLVLLDAHYTNLKFISTDTGCIKEMNGGIALSKKKDIIDQLIVEYTHQSGVPKHIDPDVFFQNIETESPFDSFKANHKDILSELTNEN